MNTTFYVILFTLLFSIGLLAYSTYKIALYYLYNIDCRICIIWVLFYAGLLSFYLSLYFMKGTEINSVYIILISIVGLSITGPYLFMYFRTGERDIRGIKYYYLLLVTANNRFFMFLLTVKYICNKIIRS